MAGTIGILGIDIVETVIGDEIRRPEVPFADLTGGVACFFQAVGNGDLRVKPFEGFCIALHSETVLGPA